MLARPSLRTVTIAAVALLPILAAACRSPAPAGSPPAITSPGANLPAAPQAIKDPDTLVIAWPYMAARSLDPTVNYSHFNVSLFFNIYDTLVFYDGESVEQVGPWLATEVPSVANGLIADGGTTYVFPIRQGVTFQAGPVTGPDGQPVVGSGVLTPEDVAYTFQRGLLADPAGGAEWMLWQPIFGVNALLDLARQIEERNGGKRAAEVAAIADVSPATRDAVCAAVKNAVQVDGGRVVFHLVEPSAPFLKILATGAGSILDKEWVAAEIRDASGKVTKKAGWDGDCATWLSFYDRKAEDGELYELTNGSGPFKLTRWAADDGWVLTRNDAYWKGPARLKEVDWKVVPEFTTRLLMYQNGDADYINVPFSNVDQIQPLVEQGAIREIKGLPSLAMWYMNFNQKVDPDRNGFIGSGRLDGDGVPPDFFSDIDVRKGFSYAWDVGTFIRERLNGNAIAAKGPVPSFDFGFDPTWQGDAFDPDKATEHFMKAFGGKLWATGFTLVIPTFDGMEPVVPQVFARTLAAINPKFKITSDDQAIKRFANVALDLEPLEVRGYAEDYHDPDDWAYAYLGSGQTTHLDVDPAIAGQLNDLILQARHEQDPAKRSAVYSQVGRITLDNALIRFNIEPREPFYEPPTLQGMVRNPYFAIGGPSDNYFWHLHKGNQ